MRRAIAPFILLLIVLAGCEIEKDPVEEPLDPSLLLTDGFCLVKENRVVLNRYDIDYYDYGAHLIYLKDPAAFEEKFKEMGPATVYADSSRIYDLSFVSMASSYIPQGPVIWYPFWMHPDFVVPIDQAWLTMFLGADEDDPREDPRIVEALKKYGQFRHGLRGEITSFRYNSPENVLLEVELRNEDSLNYYYWDPEKLGMKCYHYVTLGLRLVNDEGQSYSHQLQPLSWASADPDRSSLLESNSSVTLTYTYELFDTIPPGNYTAYFEFPGPHSVESRDELDLEDGRIWLGELQLYKEVVVE